jgi:Gluconate 2-dehydrogenase subunit 3
MSRLKSIAKRSSSSLYHAYFSFASRPVDRELARRNSSRGQGKMRWFTAEEAAVAVALAKIIVPSDDETPGLDDIDALGPPAIELLDKLLYKNHGKRDIYARGLLSFDWWAARRHGRSFTELDVDAQIALLREAQHYSETLRSGSRAVRAWRNLRGVSQSTKGSFFAAQLYSDIRNDCLQIFYTSRVSWVWLEYDGPPMDEGYPKLAARRTN